MKNETTPTRRELLSKGLKAATVIACGGLGLVPVLRARGREYAWYINQETCKGCDICATHCVLSKSAVKCVVDYSICAYRDDCPAYFITTRKGIEDSIEYHVCPTGAISRKHIDKKNYEYTIDESLCIGCGRCTRRCFVKGNGAMKLIVDYDRCRGCNDCTIEQACPHNAIYRVKASSISITGKNG